MLRPKRAAPNSLDLILDIVCNTFGCVILLSLLVALMGRGTPKAIANRLEILKEKVRQAELQCENQMLQAEISSLQQAFQNVPQEIADLVQVGQQLQEALLRVTTEIELLEANIRETEKQHQQVEKEVQTITQANKRMREELEELRKHLAHQAEEFRLSTEHAKPSLKHLSVLIRFGRFYVWHQYDSFGNRVGLNHEEFVIVEESFQGILTLPRLDRGIPLSEPDAPRRIRQRLKPFSPRHWAIDVAVWEDSFDHWPAVREVFVKEGYYYRLLLMQDGTTLVDQGGSDSLVQ